MNITFEFATQDDCLDKMVPSDLRKLVRERDGLKKSMENKVLVDKKALRSVLVALTGEPYLLREMIAITQMSIKLEPTPIDTLLLNFAEDSDSDNDSN